ncbi:hypothetical protein [Clostridium algidicarnis]|uniref:hypothetical protein n=1 Tax=Clostridium algidicarnis TaxID=37659 RepID=UPI001C0DCE22|nr:hypothetical protein [Clostridium algidicarnis]MBU3192441.1 hypothetical protein [Clostridium algidicarnis]MBU3206461.1 hypothetical protein [Clostridium algidicarnis]
MAFPVTPSELTEMQNTDALIEAEAAILQCMADEFCNDIVPTLQGGESSVSVQQESEINAEKRARLVKEFLCAYACKEYAIADIIDAVACKISVDNRIIKEECDCKC